MTKRKDKDEAPDSMPHEAAIPVDNQASQAGDERRQEPAGNAADQGERTKAAEAGHDEAQTLRQANPDDPADASAELPQAVADQHEEEHARFQAAVAGGGKRAAKDKAEAEAEGATVEEPEIGPGVGRNWREEQTILARAEDVSGPHLRMDRKPGPEEGNTGEGAPAGEFSHGAKHDPDAPWPAPLTPSAAAPSASPEPGPEPDFQHNPPQGVRFVHREGSAVGLLGPDAEDQRAKQEQALVGASSFQRERMGSDGALVDGSPAPKPRAAEPEPEPAPEEPPADGIKRDNVGRVSIDHLADVAIKALFDAVGEAGDEPEHGRLQSALVMAKRKLLAEYYAYRDRHAAA